MGIPVRLGIQQRVLPTYRQPFFDALAEQCDKGLSVLAGQPLAEEMIETSGRLAIARQTPAQNRHLLNGRFRLLWQDGLMEWLDDWRPEVLILEANPRYLRIPQAVRWMHRRKRPVIGWGLGPPYQSPVLAPLRGGFLRQFDALLTYSQHGAEQFEQAGFPHDNIFIAPNAVAPRPVHAMPERPVVIGGAPVVLFVGRLQTRKRVDGLIRACAALPEGLQPELWVVGDGPARLEFESAARQHYPQTHFFGSRFGPDLADLYKRADLFVLPGTGGLAVQQAMSYGLPVMVAEADGTQSDLVRPENGWLLPPGDEEALTSMLAVALADISRLRRMGKESYRIVAQEIHLEKMVAAFERAVRAVWKD